MTHKGAPPIKVLIYSSIEITDTNHLATGKCFAVPDVARKFCSVPLSAASQRQLASASTGMQHTFPWLPAVPQQLSHPIRPLQARSELHPTFPRSTSMTPHWWHPFHLTYSFRVHNYSQRTKRDRLLSPHSTRPHQLNRFLGIIWSFEGYSFPDTVKNQLSTLSIPRPIAQMF